MITPSQAAQMAVDCYAAHDAGVLLGPKGAQQINGCNIDVVDRRITLGNVVPFGYFAQIAEREYVAVIRGTSSLVEWIEDGIFQQAACKFAPGLVEGGFSLIYNTLTMAANGKPAWRAIADQLRDGDTVTFVGHSLGAALATYLTTQTKYACKVMARICGMYLASPKPGNSVFARAFDLNVGKGNYRVYNYLRDVVPRLPISIPLVLEYDHLLQVTVARPSEANPPIADNVVSNHRAASYVNLLRAYP